MAPRVATRVVVKAKGFGVIYEFTESVRPGDTMTVEVDVPYVIEVNDTVVGLMHKGRSYVVFPK